MAYVNRKIVEVLFLMKLFMKSASTALITMQFIEIHSYVKRSIFKFRLSKKDNMYIYTWKKRQYTTEYLFYLSTKCNVPKVKQNSSISMAACVCV